MFTVPTFTGFVDGPAPDEKRHMLRLWLKFPKPWPLSPEFPTHLGYEPSQGTPELVEAETRAGGRSESARYRGSRPRPIKPVRIK
jgi:hypothetical protein